ncbi:ArdC family protein [Acidiphilium sp.]|uniref:ArdC family protein n=1 Tax=Acidiphilium sp. TaxID=527 RepID=UPI002583DAA1|nr:zincin-like metallopeptidase domain-containing protein [Acidiphilium sp.]
MNGAITSAGTKNRGGKSNRAPRDHYQEVTDRIIAALEAGTPPWRKPWDPEKADGPAMPCNAATGQRYRGINVLTLGMSALAFSSGDPRWATYKQAATHGWQIRKGERGTTGYFFKRLEVRDESLPEDDADAVKRIPLLRTFIVFHASQIDGIPDYIPPTIAEAPWRAPEAAEIIVANSGVPVRIGGDRAFYAPDTDHIQMPPRHAFHTAVGWASTVLHELAHASGAPSRLNRDLRNRFGSPDYSREELRVEIAQVMVCAELGLAVADSEFSNNAAYVASWLERLRADRKEIFRAAADAQRIADYLLAFHPDYANRQAASPESDTGDTPEPMLAAT